MHCIPCGMMKLSLVHVIILHVIMQSTCVRHRQKKLHFINFITFIIYYLPVNVFISAYSKITSR